jgi:drug/metabolite transporter (DMT)-like permease
VRWDHSRRLAEQMNLLNEAENQELLNFSSAYLEPYLNQLKKLQLTEAELYSFGIDPNWKWRTVLLAIFQLPFFLIGLVHVAIPHIIVKRFVESKFKRKVFWSSTKMGMLLVLLPIWNILVFMVLFALTHEKWYFWLIYFVSLNFVALVYYLFIKNTTLLSKSLRYNAQSLQPIVAQRSKVLEQLEKLQF